MVELQKGHNLVIISRNMLKKNYGHLNGDFKSYAKYFYPSSSVYQDIVLTRFFYCINCRVEKGHNLVNISWNLLEKLIRSSKH